MIPIFLNKPKIDQIGFDTIYLEKPVSQLIKFDWKSILDKPPENSSKTTINELYLISKETQNRTDNDVELIHNIDQELDQPFILLCEKYRVRYPVEIIEEFYQLIYPVLINIKGLWNRPRPNQLAKIYNINIDLIITDTIHTASYPSGHTVYSSLIGHIIKYMYPAINQKEIDNIVLETARARVMQGVHYPTDNKASLVFSKFMFDKLKELFL